MRGTVQADVLKEVQAQNELIFPIEPSLRFLADMVDYCSREMPRWYPISISGYHIAEAGATPVQQAAYTLSNGFAYVDYFRNRGMDVNVFGPRLSFFLDCGLDVEYVALARVCRKIWAIGMRDVFTADKRAQILKLHTQTSGRSLIAADWPNNLTRTALELMLACMNATNSCHSNSADEPFTTPSAEYARYAAHAQAILLEESGLFKHMMNTLQGSPGMKVIGNAVEEAILEEFREIEQQGGVIGAVERRYQRSQIQASGHTLERQIYDGVRPVIGLNRYHDPAGGWPEVSMIRTPKEKKQLQRDRLHDFEKRHAEESERCLDRLSNVVESGGNVFEELIRTVEHCSLGQITDRLCEVVGKFRPMVYQAKNSREISASCAELDHVVALNWLRFLSVRDRRQSWNAISCASRILDSSTRSLVSAQNKLRRRNSRFAHPKFRIHQNPANPAFATSADALEERARGDLALPMNRLADRSQGRVEVPAQFDAVKADHRELGRYANSVLGCESQQADAHQIVAGKDGCQFRPFEQPSGSLIPAFGGKISHRRPIQIERVRLLLRELFDIRSIARCSPLWSGGPAIQPMDLCFNSSRCRVAR